MDTLNKIEPSAGPFSPSSYGGAYPSTFTGMPPVSNFSPSQITPKKKKRKGLILSVCAGVLVLAFGIYSAAQMYIVSSSTKEEDYRSATAAFNRAPWLQLFFKKDYTYVYGMNEWTRGNYQESLRALNELPDEYEEVAAAKQQVSYDMGTAYIEAGKAEDALSVFGSLGNYKDSKEIVVLLKKYLAAPSLQDEISRYISYIQLGDFLDSAQKAQELQNTIIDLGFTAFENGNLSGAKRIFDIVLPNATLSDSDRETITYYSDSLRIWDSMTRINSYSDALPLLSQLEALDQKIYLSSIFASDEVLYYYFHGEWHSNSGGWFTYNSNTRIFDLTNIYLPYVSFSFQGGTFSTYEGGTDYLAYECIDYNTLKFTDLRNGRTYTFTRQ